MIAKNDAVRSRLVVLGFFKFSMIEVVAYSKEA
jgi:hypothetical protein